MKTPTQVECELHDVADVCCDRWNRTVPYSPLLDAKWKHTAVYIRRYMVASGMTCGVKPCLATAMLDNGCSSFGRKALTPDFGWRPKGLLLKWRCVDGWSSPLIALFVAGQAQTGTGDWVDTWWLFPESLPVLFTWRRFHAQTDTQCTDLQTFRRIYVSNSGFSIFGHVANPSPPHL